MVTEIGAQRIERLRQRMRERGIDALVCMKPQSSFYLSGFNPIIYSHPVVAILPRKGEPSLLVHALRDDHSRQSSWVQDIRLFGAWSSKKTMAMDWLAALRSILEERGVLSGTLGIDGDFVPVSTMRTLEQRLPEARFEDISGMITEVRMVKDSAEIALIRAAAQIADHGMDTALEAVAARKSEQEISIAAMAAMNRAWVEQFPQYEVADFASLEGGAHNGLWCYCLTGNHIEFNCDNPTATIPAEGDLTLVVIWSNCNAMHAENERTVAMGRLDAEKQRAYEAVLQVTEKARTALRPGITCAEVFNTAKSVYEQLGYAKYLPGRIGHGLGLGGHEYPSLGPHDRVELRPGMVMSFEPGLRVPGVAALQHSDTILITETGYELLTHTRRGFIRV
jgi:Xaa-Pro dipeptidase